MAASESGGGDESASDNREGAEGAEDDLRDEEQQDGHRRDADLREDFPGAAFDRRDAFADACPLRSGLDRG